jgi:hypothetical protein
VQQGILKAFPRADLDVLVVWISMMRADTFKTAQRAAAKFKDRRVKQFFDPRQRAGQAFAKSLGSSDKAAWDFYLFYPIQALWRELPPPPEAFMHQLRDSWADQKCLFERDQLKVKLGETMKMLFS